MVIKIGKFRYAIILIFSLLLTVSTSAGEVMTKAEFTSNFLEKLKSEIPNASFKKIDNLHIYTNDINGIKLNVYLDNVYQVYKSGNKTLEQIYSEQLKSIKNETSIYKNKNLATILPIIKPKDYIETVKEQLRKTGYHKKSLPFYYEKLNDDLLLMYVFDSPKGMSFVSPEEIKKNKSIKEIANKNIEQFYQKIGAKFEKLDTNSRGDVYQFFADGNYEASILEAIKYIDKSKIDINGDIVLFVPARDMVLITGSKDKEGIKTATDIAAKIYSNAGYAISPYGYIINQNRWKRIVP